jgi:protein-tyrosine phosphatase
MQQMTQELLLHGYYPIIAHIERYACIADDYEKAAGLQEMGAWIQVNADAVLGMEGWAAKRLCRALLREGWVDVIASDSHGIHKRACHLKKCLEYVSKKYSEDYAGQLFEQNPRKMILAAAQH